MKGPGGALAYLLARSTINRARAWVRRITTPRYAAAFLVGAGYLYVMLGRSRFPTSTPTTGIGDDFVPLFYEMAVVLAVVLTWVFGAAEPGIYFTPADIQMLFPAPVSRRALVRYKLVQAQLPILFTVFVWRMIFRSTSPSFAPGRASALWVVVTTLYLHRVGASFVKVSAAQRGLSGLRRNAIPIAVVLLAFATFIWGIVDAFPAIQAALDRNPIQGVLTAVRATPQARIVLWPFDTLVAPLTAHTAAERFRTMSAARSPSSA